MKIINLLTHTTDYDGLGVKTLYSTELAKWKTIFDDGATLMFRSAVNDSGFADLYFKLRSISTDRSLSGSAYFYNAEWPLLVYTVDYQEVDRPLTSSVGLGLTGWEDVYDNNVDWNEVAADHADWASVLSNPLL